MTDRDDDGAPDSPPPSEPPPESSSDGGDDPPRRDPGMQAFQGSQDPVFRRRPDMDKLSEAERPSRKSDDD